MHAYYTNNTNYILEVNIWYTVSISIDSRFVFLVVYENHSKSNALQKSKKMPCTINSRHISDSVQDKQLVFFLLGSISYFDSSIFYHIELLQCQWMFWVIDVSYHIWKKLIQVIILIILVTVRFIGLKNMPYRCKTDMFSCQHSKNTHVSLIFNTLVYVIIVC